MTIRPAYAGDVDDVERLRTSLDFGSEWTKDEASRVWHWSERRFRAAVSELRESGYPVVSLSEHGSVYRKARSRAELEEFITRELLSRTRHLEQQIRALRDGADKHFGSPQLHIAI